MAKIPVLRNHFTHPETRQKKFSSIETVSVCQCCDNVITTNQQKHNLVCSFFHFLCFFFFVCYVKWNLVAIKFQLCCNSNNEILILIVLSLLASHSVQVLCGVLTSGNWNERSGDDGGGWTRSAHNFYCFVWFFCGCRSLENAKHSKLAIETITENLSLVLLKQTKHLYHFVSYYGLFCFVLSL